MGFFAKVLLGDGKLKPALRAELEAEGLVLLDEDLPGSVSYSHFKAPGRRHHGKVTPERIALARSERRPVLYCRSRSRRGGQVLPGGLSWSAGAFKGRRVASRPVNRVDLRS